MVPNSMMFRAASAFTAIGSVLALANWYAEPEAALAWTAVLAMFANFKPQSAWRAIRQWLDEMQLIAAA